jgi:glucose/arabinose dehydrogenase
VEPDPRRTTIQVLNADGALQPFARGLHNAIRFDWDPQTRRLWANDTGQDNLGDDVPPDEINLIEGGKHYGFRWSSGRTGRTTANRSSRYRDALFLAMHESASKNNGYKVVLVMRDGRPTGLEDFSTGWLKDGVVLGRPAGLATLADGALYVSDDNNGFIYRTT